MSALERFVPYLEDHPDRRLRITTWFRESDAEIVLVAELLGYDNEVLTFTSGYLLEDTVGYLLAKANLEFP